MRPLREFPLQARRKVRFVLCDIDDTLTDDGRLTARAYAALERLQAAGLKVVPVTGRPAGWCDLIARFWPVDAVVGENGAFYFAYDRDERRMTRCFWKTQRQRREDRGRLALLEAQILAQVPGAAVAADQALSRGGPRDRLSRGRRPACRRRDRAHRRDLRGRRRAGQGQLDPCQRLVRRLRQARDEPDACCEERFGVDPDAAREQVLFVGDSPNDAPMFAYFAHTVGVANVRDFAGRLAAEPAWVTEARGGAGFAELAAALLAAR